MVFFRRTHLVDSHHTNQYYQTVIGDFDLAVDKHVHKVNDKEFNWVPKDSEVEQLVVYMVDTSPTFRAWLMKYTREYGPKEVAAFV